MRGTRRTPLIASGFIAGALLGTLPPVQTLYATWQCAHTGGRYDTALRACEYRARPGMPPAAGETPRPLELMDDGDR